MLTARRHTSAAQRRDVLALGVLLAGTMLAGSLLVDAPTWQPSSLALSLHAQQHHRPLWRKRQSTVEDIEAEADGVPGFTHRVESAAERVNEEKIREEADSFSFLIVLILLIMSFLTAFVIRTTRFPYLQVRLIVD